MSRTVELNRLTPIIFSALLLLNCTATKKQDLACPPSLPAKRILSVPSFLQTAYQCGPAALAMVMNYYGIDVRPDDITAKVYSSSLEGTLITDLKKYASTSFPKTRIEKLDLCGLLDYISRGIPPILFVDLGGDLFKRPHYLVATGYDIERRIIFVHTGYEANAPSNLDSLVDAWEKAGRLALIVEK